MKRNNTLYLIAIILALIASITVVSVKYINTLREMSKGAETAKAQNDETQVEDLSGTSETNVSVEQQIECFYDTLNRYECEMSKFNKSAPLVFDACEMMNDYYNYCQNNRKNYLKSDDSDDYYESYNSFVYAGEYCAESGEEESVFFDGDLFADKNDVRDGAYYYTVSLEKQCVISNVIGGEWFVIWKDGKPAEEWEKEAVELLLLKFPEYKEHDSFTVNLYEEYMLIFASIINSNDVRCFEIDYDLSYVIENDDD